MKRKPDQHEIWTASKAQCQRMHARKRARERFGIDLTNEDIDALVGNIVSGRASRQKRQSCRVVLYKLFVGKIDRTITVVFDQHRQEIITFLPEPQRQKQHPKKPPQTIEIAVDTPCATQQSEENTTEYPLSVPCETQISHYAKAIRVGKALLERINDDDSAVYRYSYPGKQHIHHIRVEVDPSRQVILKAERTGRAFIGKRPRESGQDYAA